MRLLVQFPMNPLSELRDIHLPPPPPWWPPAPGWWLISIVAIASLVLGLRFACKAWRRGRGRRAAVRALEALRCRHHSGEAADVLAADLAILLRRAAMNRHPRAQVAGLTGNDWLNFLDGDDNSRRFTNGVGACLATAPYARQSTVDMDALLALCEAWIGHNA